MGDILETVLIKGKNGPIRVNKRDYEKDQNSDNPTMKLHTNKADNETNENTSPQTAGAAVTAAEGVTMPPVPSAPNTGTDTPVLQPSAPILPGQLATIKQGKKIVVVTAADGQPVTGNPAIDENGYKTDADAWAAIMAVQGSQTA